jgi:hypothetical protein
MKICARGLTAEIIFDKLDSICSIADEPAIGLEFRKKYGAQVPALTLHSCFSPTRQAVPAKFE